MVFWVTIDFPMCRIKGLFLRLVRGVTSSRKIKPSPVYLLYHDPAAWIFYFTWTYLEFIIISSNLFQSKNVINTNRIRKEVSTRRRRGEGGRLLGKKKNIKQCWYRSEGISHVNSNEEAHSLKIDIAITGTCIFKINMIDTDCDSITNC